MNIAVRPTGEPRKREGASERDEVNRNRNPPDLGTCPVLNAPRDGITRRVTE